MYRELRDNLEYNLETCAIFRVKNDCVESYHNSVIPLVNFIKAQNTDALYCSYSTKALISLSEEFRDNYKLFNKYVFVPVNEYSECFINDNDIIFKNNENGKYYRILVEGLKTVPIMTKIFKGENPWFSGF